jgi:protein-L-isoaspartate(D-aspartate) O-methyltransferase
MHCVTGDRRKDYEPNAPYDRIVAWTTPETLPDTWKAQLSDGGTLVAPFRALNIAGSTVMIRFLSNNSSLQGDLIREEGYIMMTEEPAVFGQGVHADIKGDGGNPCWASSDWMKIHASKEWLNLFSLAKPEPSPFPQSGRDIRAFLLGINPSGYTYAFHPVYGYFLGVSSPNGFALIRYHQIGQWVVTDKGHEAKLHQWFDDWEKLGKPGNEALQPLIVGNQVRVKIKGA